MSLPRRSFDLVALSRAQSRANLSTAPGSPARSVARSRHDTDTEDALSARLEALRRHSSRAPSLHGSVSASTAPQQRHSDSSPRAQQPPSPNVTSLGNAPDDNDEMEGEGGYSYVHPLRLVGHGVERSTAPALARTTLESASSGISTLGSQRSPLMSPTGQQQNPWTGATIASGAPLVEPQVLQVRPRQGAADDGGATMGSTSMTARGAAGPASPAAGVPAGVSVDAAAGAAHPVTPLVNPAPLLPRKATRSQSQLGASLTVPNQDMAAPKEDEVLRLDGNNEDELSPWAAQLYGPPVQPGAVPPAASPWGLRRQPAQTVVLSPGSGRPGSASVVPLMGPQGAQLPSAPDFDMGPAAQRAQSSYAAQRPRSDVLQETGGRAMGGALQPRPQSLAGGGWTVGGQGISLRHTVDIATWKSLDTQEGEEQEGGGKSGRLTLSPTAAGPAAGAPPGLGSRPSMGQPHIFTNALFGEQRAAQAALPQGSSKSMSQPQVPAYEQEPFANSPVQIQPRARPATLAVNQSKYDDRPSWGRDVPLIPTMPDAPAASPTAQQQQERSTPVFHRVNLTTTQGAGSSRTSGSWAGHGTGLRASSGRTWAQPAGSRAEAMGAGASSARGMLLADTLPDVGDERARLDSDSDDGGATGAAGGAAAAARPVSAIRRVQETWGVSQAPEGSDVPGARGGRDGPPGFGGGSDEDDDDDGEGLLQLESLKRRAAKDSARSAW